MFRGSITALITPFRDGRVDVNAFQDFVDWQIKQGSHGVVPVGTTGEISTLSHEEHRLVVSLTVEVARGRVPVIAGTGSNATEEAIALTRYAKQIGADAALIVAPYYNKPTQEGLYQHYKAIHDAVDLPIIVYNVPGRTIVDISIETLARLAALPNIVGVKDATGDLSRPARVRTEIGPDFCQLSGDDATALAFLAQGGVGCISVASNVAPALCAAMQDAWGRGDLAEAGKIRDALTALHHALFLETSPAPAKYAAHLLGRCLPDVRLPLVACSQATQAALAQAMQRAGILSTDAPFA
jgi:4-hydroxy-tetrahydrodipicolinate synthase